MLRGVLTNLLLGNGFEGVGQVQKGYGQTQQGRHGNGQGGQEQTDPTGVGGQEARGQVVEGVAGGGTTKGFGGGGG